MFLIQDGCLKRDGFSFKLPNGLYLQTESDIFSEHEVHFIFKDVLHMLVSIDPYDTDIDEDLQEDINNGSEEVIQNITHTVINGMKANYTIYFGSHCQYFAMNFEPKSSNIEKKVKIIGEVYKKSNCNIIDLLKEAEIKDFIESITMD